LARSGPVSPQDRWEEDPGYTPFTVAAEFAALLAAAKLADLVHEAAVAGCTCARPTGAIGSGARAGDHRNL